MSWQLAAFSILALGLAAGFAWYERTRPDAKIVALVGTLAAFAALGRIAFVAVPNIKPTSDIVLISGYALGGAPGFVVGALAGLTSNFFFGQGPWTPWQMFAWGATGLLGAGLARATIKPIGRWPLAVIAAVSGFAFTAFQDFGDWVTYSDHSLSQLGAHVGTGIGFDFVYAAGCFAFALAFGPALAGSLRRFGARMQINWRTAGAVPVILAIAVAAQAASMATAAPARAATPDSYLLRAQHRDGGFGSSPGAGSSGLYTGWTALGLAAHGHNPADVRRGGASVLDYVRAGVRSLSDVGSLERTILVVRAAGASARSFGGRDLVAALQRALRPDGSIAEQVNLTAFAVMALRASGVSPTSRTLSWLLRQQDRDGGFNFATAGGASDIDDTGAALEALAGVGGAGRGARSHAVAFLRREQDRDGGFPLDPGGESNAQSTAWAVQGLIAANAGLHGLRHGSPLRYLRTLIGPDGHVHYSRTTDQTPVWVTAEAVIALAGKPLPLAPLMRPRGSRGRSKPASAAAQARQLAAAPRRATVRAHIAGRPRNAAAIRGGNAPVAGGADVPAMRAAVAGLGLAAAIVLAPMGV